MGCFGGGADVDTGASKASAQLSTDQWNDFQQRYIPLEHQLMEYTDSGTSILNADGTTTNSKDEMYSFDTADIYSGKGKWKRKADKLQSQIDSGTLNDKKLAKKEAKLGSLQSKIDANTVKGQHYEYKNTNTLGAQLSKADDIVSSQFEAGMGNTLRSAARYGGLTPAQKAEAERLNKLDASKTRITARNSLRDAARDSDLNISGSLMGIGRGVAQNAAAGYGTVANIEAQNNAFNQNAALNASNTTMTNIGTGVGLAAMALML